MKNGNEKFVVIGGQYEPAYYGCRPTLEGAKRLATKNAEYWDNWQGWHKPNIYRIEDTHEIETRGMITYYDGIKIRVARDKYVPFWAWNITTKKWEFHQCDFC